MTTFEGFVFPVLAVHTKPNQTRSLKLNQTKFKPCEAWEGYRKAGVLVDRGIKLRPAVSGPALG